MIDVKEKDAIEISDQAFKLLQEVQKVMDLEVFIFEAYKSMTGQVLKDYFDKVFNFNKQDELDLKVLDRLEAMKGLSQADDNEMEAMGL